MSFKIKDIPCLIVYHFLKKCKFKIRHTPPLGCFGVLCPSLSPAFGSVPSVFYMQAWYYFGVYGPQKRQEKQR